MKNVLLIPGFNGIPQVFYYFKQELEKLGFNVIMPEFPVKEEISVETYFNVLDNYKEYFSNDLIVIAHSIGNPMFIKFISKNKFKIGKYISLAGFSKEFVNDGKEVLNEKVKLSTLSEKELNDGKILIKEKYSIYSNTDHIVPIGILEQYCKDIESIPIQLNDVGHMGKKSNISELPKVIELIIN